MVLQQSAALGIMGSTGKSQVLQNTTQQTVPLLGEGEDGSVECSLGAVCDDQPFNPRGGVLAFFWVQMDRCWGATLRGVETEFTRLAALQVMLEHGPCHLSHMRQGAHAFELIGAVGRRQGHVLKGRWLDSDGVRG